MNFKTFAWAKVQPGNIIAFLGFESSSKSACDIVEDHVAEIEFVDEMAILEFNIHGDVAGQKEFDVVSDPGNASGTTWAQSVLTIDEGDPPVSADGGSGTIDVYAGEGSDIIISGLTIQYGSEGNLSTGITACHCEDVAKFWEVMPPE